MGKYDIIFTLVFLTFITSANAWRRVGQNFTAVVKPEELIGIYPDDSPLKIDFKMEKFNRTITIIEINVTITEIIDRKYYVTFEVQTWRDGGWKRNAVKYENYGLCEQLKFFFGPGMVDILVDLGLGEKCPFHPGFYHFKKNIAYKRGMPFDIGLGRAKYVAKLYNPKKELILTVMYTYTTNEYNENG